MEEELYQYFGDKNRLEYLQGLYNNGLIYYKDHEYVSGEISRLLKKIRTNPNRLSNMCSTRDVPN